MFGGVCTLAVLSILVCTCSSEGDSTTDDSTLPEGFEPIDENCTAAFFYNGTQIAQMLRDYVNRTVVGVGVGNDWEGEETKKNGFSDGSINGGAGEDDTDSIHGRQKRVAPNGPCGPDEIWDFDACSSRCVDNYPNATVRYSDGSSYYIVTRFDGVPVKEYKQYIPYAYCPLMGAGCAGNITISKEKRYIIVRRNSANNGDMYIGLFDVDTYCNCSNL